MINWIKSYFDVQNYANYFLFLILVFMNTIHNVNVATVPT